MSKKIPTFLDFKDQVLTTDLRRVKTDLDEIMAKLEVPTDAKQLYVAIQRWGNGVLYYRLTFYKGENETVGDPNQNWYRRPFGNIVQVVDSSKNASQ